MADLRTYQHLPQVQLLKRVIRSWWGLELAFADANGSVLDHAEGRIIPSQNPLCRAALFSNEGFRRCNDSVKQVRDRLRRLGEERASVHTCHLGLDIVAAPVHLDGELAGFAFTGGNVHAPLDDGARAALLAELAAFAPDEARALADTPRWVPTLSEAELSRLRDLVALAAAEVVAAHEARRDAQARAEAEATPITAVGGIVGESPPVKELFKLLDKIVRSESTVMIHGESGTGKELIARAIHERGSRAQKPFVVQNCSAFNDNLLESALFGHARGAFTGAVKDTDGLFKAADGGTFFLDEIGDMSPALQVKLLRVLQESTFTPVGATKPIKVDVRVIAATHKDLTALVERGVFREDLYYRVNVLKITVPPLRDRRQDIPMLARHFLAKHARQGKAPPRLSDVALAALEAYGWPGNIRELENEIERMMVLGAELDEIGLDLVSPRVRDAARQAPASLPASATEAHEARGTLKQAVEALELEMIQQGLNRTHWNKTQLAKDLGISRSNLIQKCAYYGLDRKEDR